MTLIDKRKKSLRKINEAALKLVNQSEKKLKQILFSIAKNDLVKKVCLSISWLKKLVLML